MYPKEIIRTLHQSLNPELLDLIASDETLNVVEKIATEQDLSVVQMNKLSTVLTWTMLGLVERNVLQSQIQEGLGVPEELAQKIEKEVKESIFSKIPSEVLEEQEIKARILMKSSSNTSSPKLPMIEEGEVAHDVPHVETAPIAQPAPNKEPAVPSVSEADQIKTQPKITHYPGGVDPYREPLA